MKGRGFDATLCVIATLTAAWPISTLLAEPTWVSGTVALLLVIAISGVGARSLALRGWQVLAVQLACLVLTASAIYGRGHLWHGLPTFDTVRHAGSLISQALATAQKYSAPAPSTAGLTFVVACSLGLVAVAVDYLAVTRRSPSLAGLPLLATFLAAAANSGSELPLIFFVAAAAMWLVLVARQGSSMLRRWGTTVAVPHTPVRENPDSVGVQAYASVARTLGVAALVAAAAVPALLPHLPPKFLVSGLGRNVLATGQGSGTVGFSLSLNLAADLSSLSTAPVLQYTTSDTSPPPLRVAVSSVYDSEQGVWIPPDQDLPALSRNPDIPTPTGLSGDVPKKRFSMDFNGNQLSQPNLAAPYPLITADLNGTTWGLDDLTQGAMVGQRPDSYSVSYWRLEPTTTMLENAQSSPTTGGGNVDDDLVVDPRSFGTVSALTRQVTKGKTSAYDKAMAIQQYLRAAGGFTYSLKLAPPAKNRSGKVLGYDPLTNFLVTKQGYCVQFASAMAMMARAAGIPARMAIGFLPGARVKGVWSVTAADAHTWPELYLDGIGWTRFEPTPSRATPPGYAIAPGTAGTPAGGAARSAPNTTAIGNTARKDSGDPATDTGVLSPTGTSLSTVLGRLTHGWGLVLLVSVLLLLGSLLVPAAAAWRRRRALRAARTAAQRVEVHWELLTSSLGDLGIPPAPSHTPRQLRAYYDREAFLEGAASEALGRVVGTLERSRYAPPGQVPEDLSADSRLVLRTAAANRRRGARIRAGLWPSGGLAELRATRAGLARRVLAPWRDLLKLLRQRVPGADSSPDHHHR
jgi:transglutaminase-like putative cysteine protease